MGKSNRNFFLPLALAYLVSPALIFLATWIRPAIGLPAALIVAAGLIRLARSPDMLEPRPAISRTNLWLVLGLALAWTILGGVGGIAPQSADYIKHSLLFHDLIHQSWPVNYTLPGGEKDFLCYGLGYYLAPALGAKLFGADLLPGFTLAWTFGGLALFLYWVATLDGPPRKNLAMVLLFAVTGILWKLVKDHGFPGLIGRDVAGPRLFELGLSYSYNDSFTRFQYQPQHALVGWLGAAVLYEMIWVKGNHRGVFFVWVSCLLWSPLSCLGLLLVPLAALTRHSPQKGEPGASAEKPPLARSSPLLRRLKTSIAGYFEPINLIAGGVWLFLLAVYLQAHVPVARSGPIWTFAHGVNWLVCYALFIVLELSAVLLLILADRRHRFLGQLRPLVCVSTGLMILLPLYRLGLSSDLRLEASAPALLFISLGAARCWESPAFTLKRPVFVLLTVVVLIGALYPLLRPWQNLLANRRDRSYAGIVKDYGYRDLTELRDPDPDSRTAADSGPADSRDRRDFNSGAQYLGRADSAAGRWLLRQAEPSEE